MSSFVHIDRLDSSLQFKALDGVTVNLSVYRRDDISNLYKEVLRDVKFTDTYSYDMEKNNLYKFVFSATIDSDTIIGPYSAPPQIPPMPDLPSITIPTAPSITQATFVPAPTGADIFLAKITAETFAVNAKTAQEKVTALEQAIQQYKNDLDAQKLVVDNLKTSLDNEKIKIDEEKVKVETLERGKQTAAQDEQAKRQAWVDVLKQIQAQTRQSDPATDSQVQQRDGQGTTSQTTLGNVQEELTQAEQALATATTKYNEQKLVVEGLTDKYNARMADYNKRVAEWNAANDKYNVDKANLEKLKQDAIQAKALADVATQAATERGQNLIDNLTQLDQNMNKISVDQNTIKTFSIAVDNYNSEKNIYNNRLEIYEKARRQYDNQLAAFNAETDRHQIIRKKVVYEYNCGYYPDLLDNIITGCVYTLNRTEDVDVLYNNKDRQANTTILRMLYYNALCYNQCNENIVYTLSSLYFRLKHHVNMFEANEYHRGLDNTFIQEKVIMATFYMAYLIDALRFAKDNGAVMSRFKFYEIFPSLKLLNFDINKIGGDVGIQFDIKSNRTIDISDITIVLQNRQVYNFKKEDFIKDDTVVNYITFLSVPDEGVLYYNDVKVTLGQKINFDDIEKVEYIAKDVNYSYLSSFRFLLEQ